MSLAAKMLDALIRYVKSPQGIQTVALVTTVLVVSGVTLYLNTKSKKEAEQMVDELARRDASKLDEVYRKYRSEMSPQVRAAFEQARTRTGE